jgi:hypothetical protein
MKSIRILAALFWIAIGSVGQAAVDASEPVKCVHQDGYGIYVGYGATKNEARTAASTECFNAQVEMYRELKGHYPSDEDAEPLLFSCVNICR